MFSKSELFGRPLPPGTIGALVEELATGRAPGETRELNFTALGGAYSRVPPDATAHPHGTGRVYPNFPDPELPAWDEAYHAGNRERLLRIKRAYDPENVFQFVAR